MDWASNLAAPISLYFDKTWRIFAFLTLTWVRIFDTCSVKLIRKAHHMTHALPTFKTLVIGPQKRRILALFCHRSGAFWRFFFHESWQLVVQNAVQIVEIFDTNPSFFCKLTNWYIPSSDRWQNENFPSIDWHKLVGGSLIKTRKIDNLMANFRV